ncbi:hypothetical protein PAEPH01_0789 [Pancytospora epiphaga]|nr:hypothetical protein PAEPH01_0789 [Pancytospora epiphaga]
MQQDGPRLKKLKAVYKRAIQEILSEEDALCATVLASESRDSFYGDRSEHPRPDEIKKVFIEIKQLFSQTLKDKICSMNLDFKLNSLDKDIKEGRISYQDIKSPEYIKDIFESYVVDKKGEFVRALEEMLEKAFEENRVIEDEVMNLKSRVSQLEAENLSYENEYNKLIEELEMACRD